MLGARHSLGQSLGDCSSGPEGRRQWLGLGCSRGYGEEEREDRMDPRGSANGTGHNVCR